MSFLADHNPVCLKVSIMFRALLLATCSSQFMMYIAVAYVLDSCCGVASLQLGFRWLDVRVVTCLL